MSEHQETPSQDAVASEAKEERRTSLEADASDKETETVEDAVDTNLERSPTKRRPSIIEPPTVNETEPDVEPEDPPSPTNTKPNGSLADELAESAPEPPLKPAPRPISQTSAAALDTVDLDDEATAADPKPTVAENTDEHSPIEKERAPSKTISLSSITSALPSLPWSPAAQNDQSPTKSSVTSTSNNAPSSTTRKLTSPFSWLSRSSPKDQGGGSPPSMLSPRRNTASSIATLMSSPDVMMLERLDEEVAENGMNGRATLKDRFKLLRMREEAGIVIADDNKDGNETTGLTGLGVSNPKVPDEDRDTLSQIAPPPSSVPASPKTVFVPSATSGVNAEPSTTTDGPVDWDLWQSVVYEGPAAVARTSAEELNKAIATGIPSAIRGVIWQVLAHSKNEELEKVYRELVARGTDKEKDRQSNGTSFSASSNGNISNKDTTSSAGSVHSEHSSGANGTATSSPTEKDVDAMQKAQALSMAERKKKDKEDQAMLQKLEKTIRRDLGGRTSFSKYTAAQGLQEGLFGVCKAYALYDEGVGYAQGMNFLAMPLLFNMPEDEAFCLLVRLMNHYHLRDLFIQDMPGLHMRLYQFERLLEDLEPALYCHLRRRNISPHLYATQWFLTLFAYRFPLQLVLRIYDLTLSEGLSAILRFGIVLMQKNAAALLAIDDMSQLTVFLKDRVFDVYIDSAPSSNSIRENGFFGSSSSSIDKSVYRADDFVRDACEVKITPELLKFYRSEWEEKTRAEKERETELDTLRSTNASLTFKVRKLEERIEAVDREQAVLATELVHTKVLNEELQDENEGLRGQVKELRLVIEQQPAELEQKWVEERDDLLKRNQKVHEDNLRLEAELADLELNLVRTKMEYAEINSQHELLTRRWTDLKRQMNG